MPTFTNLIQEYSPLLQYTGSWITGSSGTDAAISSYNAASFIATQVQASAMTFTFNGTGVQIVGAKRPNHGLYQVSVDGNLSPSLSGSVSPDQFQETLFMVNSLQPGLHTVTVTNQENKFLDIDYVSWITSIGEAEENLIVNTIDDSSSDFQFSPSSAWTSSPTNGGEFLGTTGHETSTPGASFTYTFNGDSVSLFGPLGPNYSSYAVQVDGGAVGNYSANNVNFRPQVMLYYASGLGPGTHTLKLVYQPEQVGQIFAIDYATTSSTASLGGVPLSSFSSNSSHGLSGGSVAGIVIGVLLSLALIIGGLFYFFVWRRRKQYSYRGKKLESGFAGQEGYSEGYVAQPGRAYSMRRPARPASYMMNSPGTNGVPALPLQTGMYSAGAPSVYSAGTDDPSSPTSYVSHSHRFPPSSSSSSSNSTSPRGNSPAQFGTKSRRPNLPTSAGQSLDQVSHEELAANRMVVEGRPQDFGSVNPTNYNAVEERHEILPPPNYMQATETY